MADTLRVRLYNVHFGDAILVIVPDRDPKTKKVTTRRILIDVGNAPKVAGTGEVRHATNPTTWFSRTASRTRSAAVPTQQFTAHSR